MIRTQISLDESEYRRAKAQARAQGITVAELVRRALRDSPLPSGEGAWMQYAGDGVVRRPAFQSIDR